jgi:hypothetical protein
VCFLPKLDDRGGVERSSLRAPRASSSGLVAGFLGGDAHARVIHAYRYFSESAAR